MMIQNGTFQRSLRATLLSVAYLVGALHTQAYGQQNNFDATVVENPTECASLLAKVRGNESGSDWLIGSDIPIYRSATERNAPGQFPSVFENVVCFESANVIEDRVLVISASGSYCGWVKRSDLLAELKPQNSFSRRNGPVCPTPRAMQFDDFCYKLDELTPGQQAECIGLPPAIRAKGVITGSTDGSTTEAFAFMTKPQGGQRRNDQSFFSVLEIHDVAQGADGEVMVLAGDGEGDVFGWIDLRALELWPTRLGLFYDSDGIGRMFQSEGDLIQNWRFGDPAPDISPGLAAAGLNDYVHGDSPLFSYPIVRTVRPDLDPAAASDNDVPYHEVIFFGQTGEGSVTQLLRQKEGADAFGKISRLNLMIVVDTTESMRPYLPFVTEGLTNFIVDVDRLSRDPLKKIPEIKLAVYAYSDFRKPNATRLDDPIVIQRLMAPSRIGQFDLSDRLAAIGDHQGLDDEVGLFAEAAFETVLQLGETFRRDPIWYEGSPSMVIHIADHGSRSGVKIDEVAARLTEAEVFYWPLIITTDDRGDLSRAEARQLMQDQALPLMVNYIDNPTSQDLARVDYKNGGIETATVLREELMLLLNESIQAVVSARGNIIGDPLVTESQLLRDRASSRIDPSRIQIDRAVLQQSGLEELSENVIVQASTAYAPFSILQNNRELPVDWSYSVALEAYETDLLRQNFDYLCRLVGSPEQRPKMRALIVDLAEAFSGDTITNEEDLRAVLSDLADMPGAEDSFLAQSPNQLLQRIESSDPGIVEKLRQDICWTSYHMSNVANNLYVQPNQLLWDERTFALRPGEEAVARNYLDRPIVGPELYYLPSFFFILPTQIESGEAPGFFDFD